MDNKNQKQKTFYKKAIINGNIFAGENIKKVYPPTIDSPFWQIILTDNIVIGVTGNVEIWATLID